MKVLIIGGSGFLGSHLVDALLSKNISVRSLDSERERFRHLPDGVEFIQGSFLQGDILRSALHHIDVVCHLASTTVPASAASDSVRDVQENLVGSLLLMTAMKEQGIRRLIFISSGGTVYGAPEHLPIRENHPRRPISSYGIVKSAIELYIEEQFRSGSIDPVILRLANPYGPRQNPTGTQGVIASFLHKIRTRQSLEVWGDGSVVRDYVYVGDVAEALSLAVLSKVTGIFNVGSGTGVSINELIAALEGVCKRSIPVSYRVGRAIDIPSNFLDISQIAYALGWKPNTGLVDGLTKTWKWQHDSDCRTD